MNWLAALLTVIGSVLIGRSRIDRLRRRSELLELTEHFAAEALNGINYSLLPPDRLVTGFECTEDSFFGCCRQRIAEGMDIHAAWAAAMSDCGDTALLRAGEREMLAGLGRSLGTYDAHGQTAVLARYQEAFRRACVKAKEEKERQSGLYMSCSVLLGVLGAILIL